MVGFGCGKLLYEALGGGNSQVILVLIVGAVGEFIVIWVLALVDGRMSGYLLLWSCGLYHFLWVSYAQHRVRQDRVTTSDLISR